MSQHAIDAYLDDLLCEVETAAPAPHPATVLNAVPDVVVAAPPPPAPSTRSGTPSADCSTSSVRPRPQTTSATVAMHSQSDEVLRPVSC